MSPKEIIEVCDKITEKLFTRDTYYLEFAQNDLNAVGIDSYIMYDLGCPKSLFNGRLKFNDYSKAIMYYLSSSELVAIHNIKFKIPPKALDSGIDNVVSLMTEEFGESINPVDA